MPHPQGLSNNPYPEQNQPESNGIRYNSTVTMINHSYSFLQQTRLDDVLVNMKGLLGKDFIFF
jgi:hypothetical protein